MLLLPTLAAAAATDQVLAAVAAGQLLEAATVVAMVEDRVAEMAAVVTEAAVEDAEGKKNQGRLYKSVLKTAIR